MLRRFGVGISLSERNLDQIGHAERGDIKVMVAIIEQKAPILALISVYLAN